MSLEYGSGDWYQEFIRHGCIFGHSGRGLQNLVNDEQKQRSSRRTGSSAQRAIHYPTRKSTMFTIQVVKWIFMKEEKM